jgi:hypothetical protein
MATLAVAQNRLIWEQAYCQHKFHYFRNVLDGAEVSLPEIRRGANAGDADCIARLADITQRAMQNLPRQAAYGFTRANSARLKAVALPNRDPFRAWGGKVPALDRPNADEQAKVKENLNNFRDLLRSTFRFVKCLGWGGEGVVTLWRYRPSPDRERRVVMKAPIQGARNPALAALNINGERDTMTVSTIGI